MSDHLRVHASQDADDSDIINLVIEDVATVGEIIKALSAFPAYAVAYSSSEDQESTTLDIDTRQHWYDEMTEDMRLHILIHGPGEGERILDPSEYSPELAALVTLVGKVAGIDGAAWCVHEELPGNYSILGEIPVTPDPWSARET